MHKTLLSFRFQGVHDEEQNFEEPLHVKVMEHNIRVVCKYYRRITLKRLSHFLGVDETQAEKHVSNLVTSATIYARIDRLDGIVRFRKKETPSSILNDWRSNIDKLLDLVDSTCHQIHKEIVIHQGDKKGKKAKKGKKRAEEEKEDDDVEADW